ncbi:hypothetical protein RR46_01835 [Papilio xuthus]|uniref:Uncharacterized protein n=1 Tax=Papilio xuthus TaxID=66420 RepID=A0A194QEB6_PAPXU|nr:hypothetical protein RR46_01835 [Papilio xuthus]
MGGVGGAAALMGVEVCAPLLLLCWLCCWPDDANSDTSSEKHPRRPVITTESGRHSGELLARRFGSSAVSLHLPPTPGFKKQPLSAHRSHEEIRSRRKSHHDTGERVDPARHHSAPSVIDEVLHRRDWERSNRDLYIPLRPEAEALTPYTSPNTDLTADVDTHDHKTDEQIIGRPCKKHYTNIKSSRNKKPETAVTSYKELTAEDIKDEDVTEQTSSMSNFYIGDASCMLNKENIELKVWNVEEKRVKAKDVKQCVNESIKYRERPRNILCPLAELQVSGEEMDRSGAVHHFDSRASYCDTPELPYSPPAAEPARVLEGTCLRGGGGAGSSSRCVVRARHASAGDVLAPLMRPHSAALSESDLDYELEGCDEPPPAYDELQVLAIAQRKETAI